MLFCIAAGNVAAYAQDQGSLTYPGKTIRLTGYRTRMNGDKRWVIGEGKKGGKLYSMTVTLRPDVRRQATVTTGATHSVTLTVSNTDYSGAQNIVSMAAVRCSSLQGSSPAVSGKELHPGNCFGEAKGGGAPLSFVPKP